MPGWVFSKDHSLGLERQFSDTVAVKSQFESSRLIDFIETNKLIGILGLL